MRILSSIVFVVTTFAYLPAQVPEPFTGDLSSVFAIWPNRPTGTRIDLFYIRLKSSGFVETQQQTFTRMYVSMAMGLQRSPILPRILGSSWRFPTTATLTRRVSISPSAELKQVWAKDVG